MWIWFLVLTLAVVLGIAAVVRLLFRARTQALAIRPAGREPDDDGDRVSLAAMIRELRPSFADAIQRLRKAARGVDFRYGVPWYLLIGPADAGKSTLVANAQTSAMLGPAAAVSPQTAAGLAWHYFDGGVLIDVAAALALPRRGGDLSGWRALLHLLKRHRPRRPVDGILLAVPASLLLDEQWKLRTHDLGAAIRERIVVAQAAFGFALPVYVVITQGDRVSGFSAFADALPDNLQQGMIGWSNPHDPDMLFQGDWLEEGFEELHRGVVRIQVELFATSQNPDQSSALFLFSGELRRLAGPLRHLLEEIFRPNAYRAAAFFRGFYLTGQLPPRADRVGAPMSLGVCFFRELLDSKVFPERGLATPLPGATVAHNRVSRAALVAACALALILGFGTYLAYVRLTGVAGVQASYTGFLREVGTELELRRTIRSGERGAGVEERLEGGYRLLEQVVRLSTSRLQSIFLPASLLSPIEPEIGGVITMALGELILPDFRVGLEAKGTTLFDWAPDAIPEEDSRGLSPILADSARYRALEAFAGEYRLFVDNFFRYENLRQDGAGDLGDLAALGNYVTGRTSLTPRAVPDEPYGRALRAASSAERVDCSGFNGRVEQKARLLLTAFGTSWFADDNPVKASGDRFVDSWLALLSREADLQEVIEELDTLGEGVTTWASIGARSGEFRLPVLEREPFRPLDLPALDQCPALKPNLADVIRRVATLRDGLTETLTTIEVEPFGPLLALGDKGLELGEDLQTFRAALADLRTRDFRTMTAVIQQEPMLPERVTWRPDVIDRAVQVFDAFDRYRGEAFAELTPAYRRPVVAALTAEVARSMATRLAFDAAAGNPLPSESTALLESIEQLGARLTKLSRLLPLLEDGDEAFASELAAELEQQAIEALAQLERDASPHHPYLFARQSDFVLSAWAETENQYAAPAESLKRWAVFVEEQRESIRRYALQARPLIDFLEFTDVATSPLERRWAGLLADVDSFDQKLAGNGLMALDAFLREGVPGITPERDCVATAGVVRARVAGSYLVGVRTELLDDTVARCRELARSSIESRYAAVARAFNESLAGRFPFSDVVDAPRNASPADVVEFLRILDRQDGRALAQQTAARSCAEGAVQFLRQIDAIYPLLASARDLKSSGVTMDVMPEFRVNREAEIGGNQIADWQLQVGSTVFREGQAAKPARWASGDPVRLVLRFARDSPSRPVTITDRWRRARDRTVEFEFGGVWGLLALLHAGRPAPAEVLAARDAGPQTLGFAIPVEPDPARSQLAVAPPAAGTFRVYLRLQLFQAGRPDPITIDGFPARAPADVGCPIR
jgi:type VI secretion system protein ImpL